MLKKLSLFFKYFFHFANITKYINQKKIEKKVSVSIPIVSVLLRFIKRTRVAQ